MDWGNYLFGFKGRIDRAMYWLFVLIGIVALIVVFIALPDGGRYFFPAIVLVSGGLLYCGLAVGAKRLHDRDKSAWWLVVFYLVPGLLEGAARAMPETAASYIFQLASLAVLIWAWIELGFLRGTIGPNRYGPDPLAGRAQTLL